MAAEQDDDVARLDSRLREPDRHADRSTPQPIEREDAVLQDERGLLRVLLGATGKVAPQVSLAPVSICI